MCCNNVISSFSSLILMSDPLKEEGYANFWHIFLNAVDFGKIGREWGESICLQ